MCSSFKFNNSGLALGVTLKFYISVAKWLKLKVRKFLGLIFTLAQNLELGPVNTLKQSCFSQAKLLRSAFLQNSPGQLLLNMARFI